MFLIFFPPLEFQSASSCLYFFLYDESIEGMDRLEGVIYVFGCMHFSLCHKIQ